MIKKILLPILFIFSVFSLKAQIYNVPNPYVNINKTTDFGILHEYIQVNNLTSSPFPMRWVATISGCSPNWDFGLTDPDSAYATLLNNDSAVFMLSDTNLNNKLIISVVHNGYIGQCAVNFRIYPLSDSTDFTDIGFSITVTQGTGVGVNSFVAQKNDLVYPNPSSGIFTIKKPFLKAVLYNSLGEIVLSQLEKEIDLSNNSKGLYFLKIEDQTGAISTIKLIKN